MLNYPNLARAALVKYKRWSKAKTIKKNHLTQLNTQIFVTEKLLEQNEHLTNELERTRRAFSELNLIHAMQNEAWQQEIKANSELTDLFIKHLKK
jgi:predicted aldo/keto reductase-like oxidoreductase